MKISNPAKYFGDKISEKTNPYAHTGRGFFVNFSPKDEAGLLTKQNTGFQVKMVLDHFQFKLFISKAIHFWLETVLFL